MCDVRQVNSSAHFYKIYHLDKADHIKSSALILAVDDSDALEQCERLGRNHNIEVWDRSRFVGIVGCGAQGVNNVTLSVVSQMESLRIDAAA